MVQEKHKLSELLDKKLDMSNVMDPGEVKQLFELINSADKLEEGFAEAVAKLINTLRTVMGGGMNNAEGDDGYISSLSDGNMPGFIVKLTKNPQGLVVQTTDPDNDHLYKLKLIADGERCGMQYASEDGKDEPSGELSFKRLWTMDDAGNFAGSTLDHEGRSPFKIIRQEIERVLEEAEAA